MRRAERHEVQGTNHFRIAGVPKMSERLRDTAKRAVGKEHMRAMRHAPTVVCEWNDVEIPYRYGYAARKQFGARHPVWNEGLEIRLRSEWTAAHFLTSRAWDAVSSIIRHGYE